MLHYYENKLFEENISPVFSALNAMCLHTNQYHLLTLINNLSAVNRDVKI